MWLLKLIYNLGFFVNIVVWVIVVKLLMVHRLGHSSSLIILSLQRALLRLSGHTLRLLRNFVMLNFNRWDLGNWNLLWLLLLLKGLHLSLLSLVLHGHLLLHGVRLSGGSDLYLLLSRLLAARLLDAPDRRLSQLHALLSGLFHRRLLKSIVLVLPTSPLSTDCCHLIIIYFGSWFYRTLNF